MSQLEIGKSWTGPYSGSPTEEQKLELTHPWKVVFAVETTPSREVIIQPGIIDFSKEFVEKLAKYNQNHSRMRDLEKFREELVTSNLEETLVILEKIEQENKNPPGARNYGRFLSSFNTNVQKEKRALELAKELCHLGRIMHFDIIGDTYKEGFHTCHNFLVSEIAKENKKIIRERIIYSIFSILGLFFAILATTSLFHRQPQSLSQLANLLLIAVIIELFLVLRTVCRYLKI